MRHCLLARPRLSLACLPALLLAVPLPAFSLWGAEDLGALALASPLAVGGWALVGLLVGALVTGGVLVARQSSDEARTDAQTWVEVPLIPADADLATAEYTDQTFPIRADVVPDDVDLDYVVAIDEGNAVRCVATLQVVRFF